MFRSNQRSSAGPRGFTLVEILCVIVILGIASAIIIPQIGSRDDLKAAAAARLLISDLMYAQNLAISNQRSHYVQFVGQQYTLMSGSPLAAITHPIDKDPYTMNFAANRAGLEGVNLVSIDLGGGPVANGVLGFDELGTPFSYDGVTATPLTAAAQILVRSGTITLTISVEPFTGDTSVN